MEVIASNHCRSDMGALAVEAEKQLHPVGDTRQLLENLRPLCESRTAIAVVH